MTEMSDLEREFVNEQKGEGSLSIYITNGDQAEAVGYDINPEDLEAIYFEGIGVPRWESLQADTVEQQTALYWERFNEQMNDLPLIGRIRDTDEVVNYSPQETANLLTECRTIEARSSHEKALRSLKKFSIAAERAADANAGLQFKPSQIPNF